jgi:protein involved in polysaccharide export with SLBB domain
MFRLLLGLAFIFAAQSLMAAAPDPSGFSQVYYPPASASDSAQASVKGQIAGIPQPSVGNIVTSIAQNFDYSVNANSDVFGANLFTGAFARQGATQFNPNYVVTVGDGIQVRLWGAIELDTVLTVDPKGNIFLPNIGPVKVLGFRNKDLQAVVESAVRRVYRANVLSYASLASAQPVRIFVGGFVHRPGLYNGTSMDSLLHYIDQAGGIDPERGSFHFVQVKRGDEVRAVVSLYDFLLDGRMPLIQLADGDVIFVSPRQNTIKVSGLVENAKRFEFGDGYHTVATISWLAKPRAHATHVRVVRNTGTTRNVEYYSLENAGNITLNNGDEIEFTADKKPGTITVRVEGEHLSAQEYILPYGAKLGELMKNIQVSRNADLQNIQLFRTGVRERQKQMLSAALSSLESSVLTARSSTNEESRLRKEEAELMLQWVDRARKIEPSGQVLIAQSSGRDELPLENGDVIRIPKQDGIVLVSGEVIFPSAIAHDGKLQLEDYIQRAGGYTQNANTSRIIIAHRDGSFEDLQARGSNPFGAGSQQSVKQGDQILVLPKVQTKNIEITRGISQIIYQLAIATKVILGL